MTEEVIQADREAAADWCAAQPFPSKLAEAPMIRAGEYDHHSLVQAFARHRLAHLPTDLSEERAREVLAEIRDMTNKRQLPLTTQINDIARTALGDTQS